MIWVLLIVLLLAVFILWLTAPATGRRELRKEFSHRNYAHRGLFGQDQRPPENSLPAFAAAVQAGYGMEMDVQFTADRRLVVFHDDSLDRMTGTHGWVRDFDYEAVCAMPLAGSDEHAPLFSDFLETVSGRTPLIIEIKSRASYSGAYLDDLCRAVLDALKDYDGPYCIESFDPRVVHRIRVMAPGVLRGQLVDSYRSCRGEGTGRIFAYAMSHCLCNFWARPDFIAWCPEKENWAIRLCRRLGAMMVMWTALPEHDATALEQKYDAVIFQWYRPKTKY